MGNKDNKKRKLSSFARKKHYENLSAKRKRLSTLGSCGNSVNAGDTGSHQNDESRKTFATMTNVEVNSNDLIHEHQPSSVCNNIMNVDKPVMEEELPYIIEQESPEHQLQKVIGRRIIDVNYFVQQLALISGHDSLYHCNMSNIVLVGEIRSGLFSRYRLRCNMCNKTFLVNSEDQNAVDKVEVNSAAIAGIVATGIGYSQFQELNNALDIPVFTDAYYAKLQDKLFEQWENTAIEVMEAAAKREKEAAIIEGRVKNGIPLVDVRADCCWSARSYGDNYKALSGAAVIIGRKFGEVLYIGVKNKYCLVCARAKKKGVEAKEHVCYKNYDGSSSGMESDIIREGFEQSLEMYGIIYARLIADGDASTYANILKANPYSNHVVQKIQCRNHLLRNMCKKLRAITKDLKYSKDHRKQLTDQKIMSMRKVVVSSIKHYKDKEDKLEATRNLHSDISNSVMHAFGDHTHCKEYFCDKICTIQSSGAEQIKNTLIWFRIKVILGYLASNSQSLIEDETTNAVESYNSLVAKLVGGKRINFSQRRSYQSRCAAAVVSYNTGKPITTLHKKMMGFSPRSHHIKRLERNRDKLRKKRSLFPRKKNRRGQNIRRFQNDYGKNACAPDMPPEELQLAKENFIKNLESLVADREAVEKKTVLQRDSTDWLELRKNLLTASNFGRVIKRRKRPGNLVKDILYKDNITHITSIAHGIKNEKIALQHLSAQNNIVIEPCGLFVDNKYHFLGASPDGLVGTDAIVEVKCPIAPGKVGMDEAIKRNKIQIYKYNKKTNQTVINKNSNWFFQVQGQLMITGREKCIFGIWGGEKEPMRVIEIEKDEKFWKERMERKLVEFYINEMVPELVDSRHKRGMPLRSSENNDN
ncbi:uncharacterized protein LOC125057211 [Pieris napi]|uniref:uncharacterized protein LOC125057211 n=1 Tax=Pieris napi TaxID=78633 RepID=UPI001FBA903B|nr:uncharacterized protein LOC125057211 [Pieris napi]